MKLIAPTYASDPVDNFVSESVRRENHPAYSEVIFVQTFWRVERVLFRAFTLRAHLLTCDQSKYKNSFTHSFIGTHFKSRYKNFIFDLAQHNPLDVLAIEGPLG
jgi:hypothetical protein